MRFDYQSFLNDKIFEELNKIKAFSPEVVEQEAAARKKQDFRMISWYLRQRITMPE